MKILLFVKKMYVDPPSEAYVFLDYCGLFITERKASKKTDPKRNSYV